MSKRIVLLVKRPEGYLCPFPPHFQTGPMSAARGLSSENSSKSWLPGPLGSFVRWAKSTRNDLDCLGSLPPKDVELSMGFLPNMCTYIYIYLNTHTHNHTHTYIYLHTHARMHARMHVHACTRTHARTHTHAHTHTRARAHAHANENTRTRAHAHTRTRAHAHTLD